MFNGDKDGGDILTGLILMLIGAALAMIIVVFIQVHASAYGDVCEKTIANQRNDGIVKTYSPAEEMCRSNNEAKK